MSYNYTMSERIPARAQVLPQEEVTLLLSFTKKQERNQRASELYQAGWTLQAIGDAFSPPARRSTVKYWVDTASQAHTTRKTVPSPDLHNIKGRYVRKTPISPGISVSDQGRLASLAPLARQYRSGMSSLSYQSVANDEYNSLIKELFSKYVTIAEISRAAGVTFRAIARRLGR